MEIKESVRILYELRAQLLGATLKDGRSLYTCFVNEKGITEGTKRIGNKIA
jgi:hypothetical protein